MGSGTSLASRSGDVADASVRHHEEISFGTVAEGSESEEEEEYDDDDDAQEDPIKLQLQLHRQQRGDHSQQPRRNEDASPRDIDRISCTSLSSIQASTHGGFTVVTQAVCDPSAEMASTRTRSASQASAATLYDENEHDEYQRILERLQWFGPVQGRVEVIEQYWNETGVRFQDTEFVPGVCALYRNPQAPDTSLFPDQLVWRRPHEILAQDQAQTEPVLFEADIRPRNVHQGMVGDCWFISSVALLATRPDLVRSLFHPAQYNPSGVYHVRFFLSGEWHIIQIDDRIACRLDQGDASAVYFARNADPASFWVQLLEKAYAKLCGSYEALIGFTPAAAMRNLTGGFARSLSLSVLLMQKGVDAVWQRLQTLTDAHANVMMACSSNAATQQQQQGEGIRSNHAYAVLCVTELVRGPHRLVCLANPWKTEQQWCGSWSVDSPEWLGLHDAEREQLTRLLDPGIQQHRDVFWIDIESFVTRFAVLHECTVFPSSYYTTSLHGCWTTDSAGGFARWILNPQFELTVEQTVPARLFLRLSQLDSRFRRQYALNLDVLACTRKPGTSSGALERSGKLLGDTGYIETSEVGLGLDLAANRAAQRYIISASTFDCGRAGSFTLTAHGSVPINLRALPPFPRQFLTGAWRGATAAGPVSLLNPQLALSVPKTTSVLIELRAHHHSGRTQDAAAVAAGLMFVVLRPASSSTSTGSGGTGTSRKGTRSGGRTARRGGGTSGTGGGSGRQALQQVVTSMAQRDIEASSPFLAHSIVTRRVSLAGASDPYVIVPMRGRAGLPGEFTLSVFADAVLPQIQPLPALETVVLTGAWPAGLSSLDAPHCPMYQITAKAAGDLVIRVEAPHGTPGSIAMLLLRNNAQSLHGADVLQRSVLVRGWSNEHCFHVNSDTGLCVRVAIVREQQVPLSSSPRDIAAISAGIPFTLRAAMRTAPPVVTALPAWHCRSVGGVWTAGSTSLTMPTMMPHLVIQASAPCTLACRADSSCSGLLLGNTQGRVPLRSVAIKSALLARSAGNQWLQAEHPGGEHVVLVLFPGKSAAPETTWSVEIVSTSAVAPRIVPPWAYSTRLSGEWHAAVPERAASAPSLAKTLQSTTSSPSVLTMKRVLAQQVRLVTREPQTQIVMVLEPGVEAGFDALCLDSDGGKHSNASSVRRAALSRGRRKDRLARRGKSSKTHDDEADRADERGADHQAGPDAGEASSASLAVYQAVRVPPTDEDEAQALATPDTALVSRSHKRTLAVIVPGSRGMVFPVMLFNSVATTWTLHILSDQPVSLSHATIVCPPASPPPLSASPPPPASQHNSPSRRMPRVSSSRSRGIPRRRLGRSASTPKLARAK